MVEQLRLNLNLPVLLQIWHLSLEVVKYKRQEEMMISQNDFFSMNFLLTAGGGGRESIVKDNCFILFML